MLQAACYKRSWWAAALHVIRLLLTVCTANIHEPQDSRTGKQCHKHTWWRFADMDGRACMPARCIIAALLKLPESTCHHCVSLFSNVDGRLDRVTSHDCRHAIRVYSVP
jgi:hypothetical protein